MTMHICTSTSGAWYWHVGNGKKTACGVPCARGIPGIKTPLELYCPGCRAALGDNRILRPVLVEGIIHERVGWLRIRVTNDKVEVFARGSRIACMSWLDTSGIPEASHTSCLTCLAEPLARS